MKKKDAVFISAVALCFSPFLLSPAVLETYKSFNLAHGMMTSFLKFAVLATLGEIIGLRISEGLYNRPGFGILPRAIVWGFLGLAIKASFIIFATGAPKFLAYLGLGIPADIMRQDLNALKVLCAGAISLTMNGIFGPLMMILHKILDMHIACNGGTVGGLFRPLRMGEHLASLDWDSMWNFVIKKTIPLFWIPAHTLTFLLPEQYQTLVAAILGIFLGVILALAGLARVPPRRTPERVSSRLGI